MVEQEVQGGIATCKYSGEIYYVTTRRGGPRLVKLSLKTLDKEEGFNLEGVPPPKTIGTVSPDHRYYVNMSFLGPGRCAIVRLDLKRGEWRVIHEKPDIINPHPQFEPGRGEDILIQHNRGGLLDEQGNLVRLAGEEGATLYVIDREGENYRPLPVGKPHTNPITGHECWIGDTGEVLLTVAGTREQAMTNGVLLAAQPGAKRARVVAKGCLVTHISVSRDGRFFVGDLMSLPGIPIVIGSVKTGRWAILCETGSSGGRPQYTHPHPYMSGDNRWVIYNSDKTGIPQIYAAYVPESLLKQLEE